MLESKRFLPSLILMIALMLIVTIAGSFFIYNTRLQNYIQQRDDLLNLQVIDTTAALSYELSNISHLTLLLKNSILIQEALNKDSTLDKALMLKEFIHFKHASPLITEMAWLDEKGNERVRLDIRNNTPQAALDNELRSHRNNPIFVKGFRAAPNSIPSILHKEGKRYYSVSTITTGFDDGLHKGLFIIHYNLAPYALSRLQSSNSEHETFLLNGMGDRMLIDKQSGSTSMEDDFHFAQAYPIVWKKLTSENSKGHFVLDNQLWRFHRRTIGLESHQETYDRVALVFAMSSKPDLLINYKHALLLIISQYTAGALGIGLFIIYRIHKKNMSFQCLHDDLREEKNKLEGAFQALKAAHKQQELLVEQLAESQKLSSLGMMVAGVAHELNTPTGGALISISTLQRQLKELTEALDSGLKRSDLDFFINNAASGLQLTEHNLKQASKLIKSFKRLAVDRSTEELSDFILDEPIQDLLTSLHTMIKNADVDLITDYPTTLALHGNPGILSQVIQNFIENAISHAFSDPLRKKIIHLDAKVSGPTLIIHIRDNGQGIAPAILPTIFDPFVTTLRSQGHTGLGLHQVHQWVHKILQGSIKVKSSLQEGTTFTVTIPINLQPAALQPNLP